MINSTQVLYELDKLKNIMYKISCKPVGMHNNYDSSYYAQHIVLSKATIYQFIIIVANKITQF